MKALVACLFLLLIGSLPAWTQTPDAQRQAQYNLDKGVAISGYDPVSYFDGKVREGHPNFTQTYEGVTYRFANAANADRFQKNPAAIQLPQHFGVAYSTLLHQQTA